MQQIFQNYSGSIKAGNGFRQEILHNKKTICPTLYYTTWFPKISSVMTIVGRIFKLVVIAIKDIAQ